MTKITTGIEATTFLRQQSSFDEKVLSKQDLKSKEQIDKAASGFEALLLHNMLKEMFASSGSVGLLGENSNESQIFKDMFNQAIADEISEGEGMGIKQFLKKELSKTTLDASKLK